MPKQVTASRIDAVLFRICPMQAQKAKYDLPCLQAWHSIALRFSLEARDFLGPLSVLLRAGIRPGGPVPAAKQKYAEKEKSEEGCSGSNLHAPFDVSVLVCCPGNTFT
jgi:hypothetical protein